MIEHESVLKENLIHVHLKHAEIDEKYLIHHELLFKFKLLLQSFTHGSQFSIHIYYSAF